MNESDLYNARKWLNIGEKAAGRAAKRSGIDIGKTIGNAGGASSAGMNGEAKPSEDKDGSAENGDGSGNVGKPFQNGDKADRIKGLYDCETGEEVTIDGAGEEGSEAYPTGFQDCKASKKPTMADLDGAVIFITSSSYPPNIGLEIKDSPNYSLSTDIFEKWKPLAYDWAVRSGNANGNNNICNPIEASSSARYTVYPAKKQNGECRALSGDTYHEIRYRTSISQQDKQSYIDNFNAPTWPAPDRNHLTWNKEKNCFEPLCPELNNQVAEKYKECKDEMILCDEDGNQVKVKAGDYGIEVTQAKYGQKSFIKNGKVQSVTKLTQAQTDDEFK